VRVLALKAVLLGTMAAPFLVLPALGQQEVDPTNYPLPQATKTVAHPTKEAMTAMKRKQRVASIHRSRRESNGQTRHASSLAQNRETMPASKSRPGSAFAARVLSRVRSRYIRQGIGQHR